MWEASVLTTIKSFWCWRDIKQSQARQDRKQTQASNIYHCFNQLGKSYTQPSYYIIKLRIVTVKSLPSLLLLKSSWVTGFGNRYWEDYWSSQNNIRSHEFMLTQHFRARGLPSSDTHLGFWLENFPSQEIHQQYLPPLPAPSHCHPPVQWRGQRQTGASCQKKKGKETKPLRPWATKQTQTDRSTLWPNNALLCNTADSSVERWETRGPGGGNSAFKLWLGHFTRVLL